ncbi:MFS general substrate transporter [Polychaeton citri CBS 116435]|uniref:MFS general substrate transporter n=1 Tax=Polychaeton citri CBS 116435 TaxID=1314669 RepID=A0A9P4Q538_9PEZI|nr:MFS general substrate transporter [Polychaeton citri CBS 116435]
MKPSGDQHELYDLHRLDNMEVEEEERRQQDQSDAGPLLPPRSRDSSSMNAQSSGHHRHEHDVGSPKEDTDCDETEGETYGTPSNDSDRLSRRTLLKLDTILLPFLSLLFLLNSLDKSNIGNAETAGFTRDAGLDSAAINASMAWFFFFFVALQPVGAALGRRFGMHRYVPVCMSLWGLCTIGHCFVKSRAQLVGLRVLVACLESGFYPTSVAYLSMWYTRFEFGKRLGWFYGMGAVAGVAGGVLSWAVFRQFPGHGGDNDERGGDERGVKSWQVLFLIEGCLTMFVALLGFFWLPHSADSAWFLNTEERVWAEQRIREDNNGNGSRQQTDPSGDTDPSNGESSPAGHHGEEATHLHRSREDQHASFETDNDTDLESYQPLIRSSSPPSFPNSLGRRPATASIATATQDAGLTRLDVLSAILTPKIWWLLLCNILSAIPAAAFSVFLPMVIHQLSPRLSLTPAASNLLTAPPFAIGAVTLFAFTRWSDRSRTRLIPILWSLGLLLIGLTLTAMSPMDNYVLRYLSLCVLLSGSYIASPLTVAWIANNTPEPGKRAILLGINGWGNLAGVFSSLLFTPKDAETGYVRPFVATLVCVWASCAGFFGFRLFLISENKWRERLLSGWGADERIREEFDGDVEDRIIHDRLGRRVWKASGLQTFTEKLGMDGIRRGDEKMTFRYGL